MRVPQVGAERRDEAVDARWLILLPSALGLAFLAGYGLGQIAAEQEAADR